MKMTNTDGAMVLNYRIGQLVCAYNTSWDEGRPSGVSACFTPGGVFVDATGTAHEGRQAIEAFVEKSRATFGSMRHMTTNHVVIAGEKSWVHRCYLLFTWGIGLPERVSATGHYDDEFIVGLEGPLFTVRRVFLDA